MPCVWVAYCGALKARLCNATDGGRAVTLNSAKLVKQRRDSVAARALSEPAWSHIGQPQLHVSVVSGYATQSCYATPNL